MATFSDVVRASWIFGLQVDPGHIPTNWSSDLASAAAAYYTAWSSNADDAVFRTSVSLESVKLAHLDASMHTQHEGISSPGTKWVGTSTAASLPWQVALCVGLYTYTPGTFIPAARTRRGRIYLPPMTSSVLDIPTKGTLSDSRVDDTLAWVRQMLLDCEAAVLPTATVGLTPGVVSRFLNKVKRTAPVINGITDLAADGVLDSQRRRTHQETKTRRALTY
jgi:hypothetical protein